MDEASIISYIADTFEGVEITTHEGNSFFSVDAKRHMPLITLINSDAYDHFSDLSRPRVFRLNIG